MATARILDWNSLMQEADPDFYRDSRTVIEYEFSSRGHVCDRVHEDGNRVFRASYKSRGPYATISAESGP